MVVFEVGRRNDFGIKFKGHEGGEYFSEEKKSLLVRELVRKGDGLGQRNVDRTPGGKERVENSGVVLKECVFDVLCYWREKGKKHRTEEDVEGCHFKNISTALWSEAREAVKA